MKKTDVNCLLGHWPFRKIYKNTFEDLKRVHRNNGISYGYVSSINSIFYNDPFEGEEELHEVIKGSDYKHILTVNPTLPNYTDDIKNAINLFDIKGVRIYPGIHGYKLDSRYVTNLCGFLRNLGLPLFLTMRLEDERLNYIMHPQAPSVDELSDFIKINPMNTILLLNICYHEIIGLKDDINSHSNVFCDTSGLKHLLFIMEKLLKDINADKIVYGSLHPLYCLKSTMLLIEKAQIDESVKEKILGINADFLFK